MKRPLAHQPQIVRVAPAPKALPCKRLLPRGDIPIVSRTVDELGVTCKFGALSLNATMPRDALKVIVALTATMPHGPYAEDEACGGPRL